MPVRPYARIVGHWEHGEIMERYSGVSDATLRRRIERLDQEERDLHQGMMDRALQAESQGRPAMIDARDGSLLAATKCVHEEMRDIEAELLRRSACAMAMRLCGSAL